MIVKVCQYQAHQPSGERLIQVFQPGDMEKAAAFFGMGKTAAPLLPSVRDLLERLKPSPNKIYLLVNALGASEYWGGNINGDAFPEAALIHRGPVYGYETFQTAGVYHHHMNKDLSKSLGNVLLSVWHDQMKRVELVIEFDRDRAARFGAISVCDKIDQGIFPDCSMGCKVPYDNCTICTDWPRYEAAKATFDPARHKSPGDAVLEVHKKNPIRGVSITRTDYCDHLRKSLNKILPDGRKVCAVNDYPRFFDISFVFIGADKTAKVMAKLASAGTGETVPSWRVAEDEGYFPDVEEQMEEAAGIDPELLGLLGLAGGGGALLGGGIGAATSEKGHRLSGAAKGAVAGGLLGAAGGAAGSYAGLRNAERVLLNIEKARPPIESFEELLSRSFLSPIEHMGLGIDHMLKGGVIGAGVGGVAGGLLGRTKEAAIGRLIPRAKVAEIKAGEIEKDITPSQFGGKAIPARSDLPNEVLDRLGSSDMSEALSTPAMMGMLLKPREFQRITIIHMGNKPLADELDRHSMVFGPTDDVESPGEMGSDHMSDVLKKILLPFLEDKSFLEPIAKRRVVRITIMGGSKGPEEGEKTASDFYTFTGGKVGDKGKHLTFGHSRPNLPFTREEVESEDAAVFGALPHTWKKKIDLIQTPSVGGRTACVAVVTIPVSEARKISSLAQPLRWAEEDAKDEKIASSDRFLLKISAAYNGYLQQLAHCLHDIPDVINSDTALWNKVHGRGLGDEFCKTAAEVGPVLGAVGAAEILSALASYKRRKAESKGDQVGFLTDMIAEHPHILAALAGLGMLHSQGSSLPGDLIAKLTRLAEKVVTPR